ncbi:MAG: FIST N-terminal domain-containing protein [Gammaproteobacteria bacterium]
MELQTLTYTKEKGWSVAEFPELDSPNTLIIAFGAQEYINDQKPLKQLIKSYPQAKIIGCSTAGEISGAVVTDARIVVAVAKFKKTHLEEASAEVHSADDSFAAGEKIAKKLNHDSLRGIFMLSDGLNVNGSQFIKGLNSLLTSEVKVTGGLAGDGNRFKQTWIIYDGELRANLITAIGFYGNDIHIGHGSRGGWDSFGPERHITKSKNNVLYELDGKPALELYKEYLGERAKGLPATGLLFPLAIRQNEDDTKEIVRTILAIDEKEQSMTFAGDIPTGYLAKLMRAHFDRLITGANEAAATAAENQQNAHTLLSIAISCVGRRLLLGEYTEEETESTLESLPKGTQQIGFYSYGEISPYASGYCDLHNQTMTLTTFSEE